MSGPPQPGTNPPVPPGAGTDVIEGKIRGLSLLERMAAIAGYERQTYVQAALAGDNEVITAAPAKTIRVVTHAAVYVVATAGVGDFAMLQKVDRDGNVVPVKLSPVGVAVGDVLGVCARGVVLDEYESLWHECSSTPDEACALYFDIDKRLKP